MATPTQRLTRRTAFLLGEEVIMAVRVRRLPASEPSTGTGSGDRPDPAGMAASTPVIGLPIIPLYRAVKRVAVGALTGANEHDGVLAFTRSGDRVILRRSRFWSLRPTVVDHHLDRHGPMSIDATRLFESLVPELQIGDEHYLVNSVDFGVLSRAVVAGEIDAPELAEILEPYNEQVRAVAGGEPESIHRMIVNQEPPSIL